MYHHGSSMIVKRLTSFTENFVIRGCLITKIFRTKYGSANASPARVPCNFRPQANITISVFQKVRVDTLLSQTCTTFARGSIGIDVAEHSYPPFKSCSHAGTSCNSSHRDSSSSSFLFVFSVSADPRDGFPRDSSLTVSFLSVARFSVLTTVYCDEDVDEAGEDEVEELVDRPGTRRYEWYVVRFFCN